VETAACFTPDRRKPQPGATGGKNARRPGGHYSAEGLAITITEAADLLGALLHASAGSPALAVVLVVLLVFAGLMFLMA
jgi:hypothetical protein